MNIALDYDGTITADPQLWAQFVQAAQAAGHKVWVVTMRYPSEFVTMLPFWQSLVNEKRIEVIYTRRKPKRPVCEQRGIFIDVWIDDTPRAVNESADAIWDSTSPEGEAFDPCDNG